MAYDVANPPKLVVPGVGDGPGIWIYTDGDAHTVIDADDYFSDGDDLGMKEGDCVLYFDDSADGSTVHFVRTPVTAGTASVTIATIS